MTNFSQSYWVHHVQTMHGDLIEVNWSWFRKDREEKDCLLSGSSSDLAQEMPVQGEVAFDPFAMMDEQPDSKFTTAACSRAVHVFWRGPWVFMIFRGEKLDATKTHRESKRIQKDHEDTLTYAKCVMVMSLQHIATISEVQGSKLVYFMISSWFLMIFPGSIACNWTPASFGRCICVLSFFESMEARISRKVGHWRCLGNRCLELRKQFRGSHSVVI